MSWRDNLRKLSHEQVREIVGLCSGAVLLLLVAVFINQGGLRLTNTVALFNTGNSNAAATALGDTQSVPPGYTGQTYPAQTTCWINYSYYSYSPNWTPLCPGIGSSSFGTTPGQTDTFSVGVFSVDLGGGAGQSVYATRTYTKPGSYNEYVDLGPGNAYCPYINSSDIYYVTGPPTCLDNSGNSNPVAYSCSGYTVPAGYTSSGDASECSAYRTITVTGGLSAPTNTTVGPAPSVNPGRSMTLEWSCLPSRTVNWEAKGGTGTFSQGGWGGGTIYSYTLATSVMGSGQGFSPSGLVNTQNITAPTTAGPYNYTLTCNGGTAAMTIPVTVNAPPPPTVTITGNGTNPTPNAIVGQPVTIVGSFTPGAGDALTETAINDFANNLWCGTGCTPNTSMWTAAPLGSKSYTFTPVSAGSYLFTPSVQTTGYPAWNNYSQSLTVTAVAACPNGSGAAGSCTACNSGYVLSGGNCFLQCPNGSGPAGSCTSCNAGYVLSGGNCAPTCPNGSGAAGSCTSCNAGYVLSGGNCVISAPVSIVTFSVNPTRVRKGTATSVPFTWKVSNPPATCTISGPNGFTPLIVSPVDGVTGSQTGVVNIAQASYFTLTCGAVTKQITIGLVPTVIEI